MNGKINLSQYVSGQVLAQAQALCRDGRVLHAAGRRQRDGSTEITGKCVDSFQFVDHPKVTVSPSGDRLQHCSCDCRQARAGELCVHCAALVLSCCETTDGPEEDEPAEERCTRAEDGAEPSLPVGAEAPCAREGSQKIREVSYSFCNSLADMYPGQTSHTIPLERYWLIFGHVAQAFMLFIHFQQWGGNCYGVSSTAAMFSQPGNDVLVSDFSDQALWPRELTRLSGHRVWKLTLLEFIEAMQLVQFCQPVARESQNSRQSPALLDEICRAVRAYERTGENPIILGVFGNHGGHEIFPLRLEEVDASSSRLYIYDPNYPLQERCMTLTKDVAGHYTNWRFPMSQSITYSGGQDNIDYNTYQTCHDAWNRRGAPDGGTAAFGLCRGVVVLDDAGAEVLRVTEREVLAYRDDVVVTRPRGGQAAVTGDSALVWLRPGAYTVRREDRETETMSLQLADTEQFVAVSTDASEVTFHVSDALRAELAEIAQPDCRYTIRLYSTLPDTCRDVLLEGVTGAEGVRAAQIGGELYAAGLAQARQVRLLVDGKTVSQARFGTSFPNWEPNDQTETGPEDEEQLLERDLRGNPPSKQ